MTYQKILIINGHPIEGSLNHSLSMAYKDGATKSGAEVKIIHLADLKFNPNLAGGYSHRTELEPDMKISEKGRSFPLLSFLSDITLSIYWA